MANFDPNHSFVSDRVVSSPQHINMLLYVPQNFDPIRLFCHIAVSVAIGPGPGDELVAGGAVAVAT